MSLILIIDDDDLVRMTLARMLASGGHQAITSAEASEGLEVLATQPVDLVITDIYLRQRMSAGLIALARELRPATPIIALSGAGEDLLEHALSLGAREVLAKPIHRVTLLQAVARCIEPASVPPAVLPEHGTAPGSR